MQKNIVELHKLEIVCKKTAKALKIPISIIRETIKKFQSTKHVTNLSGRGHVARRIEWQRLSKDHSWTISEIG